MPEPKHALGPWMRLRYWLVQSDAPHWLRVAAARPSEYSVARRIWGWPRRYALLDTLATWCGRTNYRTPDPRTAELRRRTRREMHEHYVEATARNCRCVVQPVDVDELRCQFEEPYR